jgi:KUP system potassium uptake protein
MAEPDLSQRIHFGEEIHPAKSATSKTYNKDPSISEKNGFDIEDHAMQIANADLNQKKKQVSSYLPILKCTKTELPTDL